jgi:hypothetical protein
VVVAQQFKGAVTVSELLGSNRLLRACEKVLIEQNERLKEKQHEAEVTARHARLLGG